MFRKFENNAPNHKSNYKLNRYGVLNKIFYFLVWLEVKHIIMAEIRLDLSMKRLLLIFVLSSSSVFLNYDRQSFVTSQLVVNARNQGGETIVENITANTSADTVTLEFINSDGSYVTQLMDFKSEIQIIRMYVLGEQELGQTRPQILCFVTRFMRNDFISSDAMSKLRQKNPTAIRSPEEERETAIYSLDLTVNLGKAYFISPHLYSICKEAKDGVYTQESDLKTISKSLEKDYNTLVAATSKVFPDKYLRCHDLKGPDSLQHPCVCQIHTCIMWYPCALKYCHGSDNFGRLVSYRCGIKTCKRCLAFNYIVPTKLKCLWDI